MAWFCSVRGLSQQVSNDSDFSNIEFSNGIQASLSQLHIMTSLDLHTGTSLSHTWPHSVAFLNWRRRFHNFFLVSLFLNPCCHNCQVLLLSWARTWPAHSIISPLCFWWFHLLPKFGCFEIHTEDYVLELWLLQEMYVVLLFLLKFILVLMVFCASIWISDLFCISSYVKIGLGHLRIVLNF